MGEISEAIDMLEEIRQRADVADEHSRMDYPRLSDDLRSVIATLRAGDRPPDEGEAVWYEFRRRWPYETNTQVRETIIASVNAHAALRAGDRPPDEELGNYIRALWKVVGDYSFHDDDCPGVSDSAPDDACTCGYWDAMKAVHAARNAAGIRPSRRGDRRPPREPGALRLIASLLPYIRHDAGCRCHENEGCGPCTCGLETADAEYRAAYAGLAVDFGAVRAPASEQA